MWVMRANGTGKTRVTHLGNVTAAATWSPDGKTLAFGAGGDLGASLYGIKSIAPFGSPSLLLGYYTGCEGCDDESASSQHAIDVDRFLAWSADGATIAIFNHADAQLDDALYLYNVASGEAAQLLATGGSCCGFVEWSDLAWGTDGAFGYGEVNTGDFDGTDPYVKIVYPGFASAQGDKFARTIADQRAHGFHERPVRDPEDLCLGHPWRKPARGGQQRLPARLAAVAVGPEGGMAGRCAVGHTAETKARIKT